MLAIFDGRVARRPECLGKPHGNAVSALEDGFLVNHFTSIYPDSVVISSKDAYTFAYSQNPTSNSISVLLPRFHFALKDGIFCLYQGYIEDIDSVKREFNLAEIHDEAVLVIQAFQILRQLGQRVPKKDVEDMVGNCISVLYDSSSKLVVLAGGSYYDLPVYWGIDARFNLIISNNDTVVKKACGTVEPFISGHVYACCEGRQGHEAVFLYKQPQYKVDLTDKNISKQQSVESVVEMLRQADMDRSKPCVEKWEPPAPGFVKMNTDAVVFKDKMLGIGVVIRNSKGGIEFAATRRKQNTLPELDPAVHAFIEGLFVIGGFRIGRCICESVHLDIEKNKKKLPPGLMDMMIEKVGKLAVANLSEFSVSFVSSSANKAAHRLALLAKKQGPTYWEKETPECIASIVASERPDSGCTIV